MSSWCHDGNYRDIRFPYSAVIRSRTFPSVDRLQCNAWMLNRKQVGAEWKPIELFFFFVLLMLRIERHILTSIILKSNYVPCRKSITPLNVLLHPLERCLSSRTSVYIKPILRSINMFKYIVLANCFPSYLLLGIEHVENKFGKSLRFQEKTDALIKFLLPNFIESRN